VNLVGFVIRSSFITFCELLKMIAHVIQKDHEDVYNRTGQCQHIVQPLLWKLFNCVCATSQKTKCNTMSERHLQKHLK